MEKVATGQDHQGIIPTTLSGPTSLTCPSSSTSRCSSPGAQTRLRARPSTQAAKGATGDSLKWHMSPKPLTWQRGSLSLWQWLRQSLHCGATQWALKNGRRGTTGMSLPLTLSLPFFLDPTILPSTNYARPFTPNFLSMILMQCVLEPLKRKGSHLLSEDQSFCGSVLSFPCSAPGYWHVKAWENMPEIDVMLLIAGHLYLSQHDLAFPSHFQGFYCCTHSFI